MLLFLSNIIKHNRKQLCCCVLLSFRLALESGETNFCVLDSHEVNNIQLSEYASKGIYCVPPTYFRDLILALDEKLQMVECVLPEYNIIQYSKFHCLELAIDYNIFQSEHFFWMDSDYIINLYQFLYLSLHPCSFIF